VYQDLSQTRVSWDLAQKQKFQKMMFPEGLIFDRQSSTYRTKQINAIILSIGPALAKKRLRFKQINPQSDIGANKILVLVPTAVCFILHAEKVIIGAN
jgi:hypothetical protein